MFLFITLLKLWKKLNLLFYLVFCNEFYIFNYFQNLKKHLETTEERPLVGKTWTPQLLLFLWSLLVRVNFIFIFFFYFCISLSLCLSLVTISINPASLKLLWRPCDNTNHSLLYLVMALSSFRLVLKLKKFL